ncbi:MAG: hypothetical protein ACK48S_12910 [Planctomycetia bacterium]|jgi:hypothetical protein
MPRKPGTSRAKHTLEIMPHTLPVAGGDGPQPITLTGERLRLWDDVRSRWVLESASESLLRNACEALERAAQLAETVTRDGPVFRDRFGGLKVNPAAQLERDFRGLASRTLQQLAARLEG